MSSTAFHHYQNFLSHLYSWSLGNKDEIFQKNKKWLQDQGINRGTLLDLGAGFGSHAIPASELELKVTAVDFSKELLAELVSHPNASSIHVINEELVRYLGNCKTQFDHILCLGDTLTHLETRSELRLLCSLFSRCLSPQGKVYLSWRDYKTLPVLDENRFILVKQDPQKLLTCVLEDYGVDKVKVSDLLHFQDNGSFNLRSHSYYKLKVTPREITDLCHLLTPAEVMIKGRSVEMILTHKCD